MSEQNLAVEPKSSSHNMQQIIQPQDVLCPDPLIVRLNKAFSWQQSPSRWPYYLSRAEPGRAYTKREVAEVIFRDDRVQYKALKYISWLRSIYSLNIDRKHQEVTIEGVGLFEPADPSGKTFRISTDGLRLAETYSTDSTSDEWKRAFANILAKNDVRVRCVLLCLTRWQSLLSFSNGSSGSAFFSSSKGSVIKGPDGTTYPLFEVYKEKSPANSFNVLLQRDPYTILGPFLRTRIEYGGIQIPNQIRFEGGHFSLNAPKEPSVNDLDLYLKQSLSLFRDIGALVYVLHKQGWTLDQKRCEEVLDPEVVADLFGEAPESRFLEVLQTAAAKFSNSEGLVRIADIRDYVCDELDIPLGERIDYFNKQVAYYMRPDDGRLAIGHTFHAAAPPSDCLFGDLEQEYVEFVFASA